MTFLEREPCNDSKWGNSPSIKGQRPWFFVSSNFWARNFWGRKIHMRLSSMETLTLRLTVKNNCCLLSVRNGVILLLVIGMIFSLLTRSKMGCFVDFCFLTCPWIAYSSLFLYKPPKETGDGRLPKMLQPRNRNKENSWGTLDVGYTTPGSQRPHNVEAFDIFWIKFGELSIPANLKDNTLNRQIFFAPFEVEDTFSKPSFFVSMLGMPPCRWRARVSESPICQHRRDENFQEV